MEDAVDIWNVVFNIEELNGYLQYISSLAIKC